MRTAVASTGTGLAPAPAPARPALAVIVDKVVVVNHRADVELMLVGAVPLGRPQRTRSLAKGDNLLDRLARRPKL